MNGKSAGQMPGREIDELIQSESRSNSEPRSAKRESGKRLIPSELKRFLIKVQGGKEYLPAAYRIAWFREECPEWGIDTAVIEGGQEAGFAMVRAYINNEDGRVISTGHKTETRQDFPAGWVEKAETGAISRALINAGFGSQYSGDEDAADERLHPDPGGAAPVAGVLRGNGDPATGNGFWEGPGQCPRCHAPVGKRHGKPCVA